ncbi:MAG: lipid-A-disaccharide synthase [Planctomycetes bacterium]|nr:lipid-A-disaccharide synthase [Planctomycetota bacterium]NUQ35070.1 lipid-A-disaccharide synthase [Planctomycetaceae bacterium]
MSAGTIIIVACEQSGDNYGALLARELKALQPDVRLAGIGGPGMAAAGVELHTDMIEHAATGLVEVLRSARFFLRTMDAVVKLAIERKARAVVMIDSPDFNLRIAPKLKAAGIPTIYYVSPQLWGWRSSRVKIVKRAIDRMLVIFPFEVDWYRRHGVEASFVGHPMLDLFDPAAIREKGRALRAALADDKPLIGLLPGSRRNEITRLLPVFLDAARLLKREIPEARFAVGCAPWLNDERAREFLGQYTDVAAVALHDQTHELMAAGDVLLACSGTATLEAALIGTPLIMAYKLSPLTYALARPLISRKQFFCMPNRILNHAVAPELIQGEATARALASCAQVMLGERGKEARQVFSRLESMLGGVGASQRAAQAVLSVAL